MARKAEAMPLVALIGASRTTSSINQLRCGVLLDLEALLTAFANGDASELRVIAHKLEGRTDDDYEHPSDGGCAFIASSSSSEEGGQV